MVVGNRISEQEYRELALNDPDHRWELWDGGPRAKPLMSVKHDNVSTYLGAMLINQLDRRHYRVNVNGGKTRIAPDNSFIPDVVIPASLQIPYEDDPRAFNAFVEPLP